MIALAIAAATVASAASAQSVQSMAGRYNQHVRIFDGVENAFVDNVAEIVPVGSHAAYLRIRLVFDYDHECELWGIGSFEKSTLVYDDPEPTLSGIPHCMLMLQRAPNALVLRDPRQSCDANCGAAVTFNGAKFSLKSRRPITYLRRLKASEQYVQSILEWQNRKSGS